MNTIIYQHYKTIIDAVEESEKYLSTIDQQEANIWAMTELTKEARQACVDVFRETVNAKRMELYKSASEALAALQEYETGDRIADAQAVNAAVNVVSLAGSRCNYALMRSVLLPLKGQHGVFSALLDMCEQRKVSGEARKAFCNVMYCKYNEYHEGTPVMPFEYYTEARKYLNNYFGINVEGHTIPQTLVWIPSWVTRVDPAQIMLALNEVAKIGEFDPAKIDSSPREDGTMVHWPTAKNPFQ